VILANNKILKVDSIIHQESEYIEELSLASNHLVKIEGFSCLSNLSVLKLARNSLSRIENLGAFAVL
jgi:Leucine-rich repeat (LRR) protein